MRIKRRLVNAEYSRRSGAETENELGNATCSLDSQRRFFVCVKATFTLDEAEKRHPEAETQSPQYIFALYFSANHRYCETLEFFQLSVFNLILSQLCLVRFRHTHIMACFKRSSNQCSNPSAQRWLQI